MFRGYMIDECQGMTDKKVSILDEVMSIPATIIRQCEDLAQLLGTDCSAYLDGDPVLSPLPDCFKQERIGNEIRKAVLTRKEQLLPVENDQICFVMPLLSLPRQDWVCLGLLRNCGQQEARRLLQIARVALQRGTQVESNEHLLEEVEEELHRSSAEGHWLRQLNEQRAARKRCIGQQSRQSMESLRTLVNAEAIATFFYHDSLETHGLEPLIVGRSNWTLDDVRFLMQRITKPMLGDSTIMNDGSVPLVNSHLHSCVVVPIGDVEPIGYVIAINQRKSNANHESAEPGFGSRDAELLHQLAQHLVSDGSINVLLQESEQLVLGTLRAMSNAIEARDPYTHGHSERVAHVAYEIAVRLQLSEAACQEIYLAGILHDIGKIGIPDDVLRKPGKLTPEEMSIIQQHPEIGHKILEELGKLKFALPGVLYHHERVDGQGYPHRLRGEQIPLMARIIAVSDAFDAMTSSRVYRNAMNRDRAVEILRQGMGKQWDEGAVSACLEFIAEQDMVRCDGSVELLTRTKVDDWRQVSQALRVLQL